jgi:hypothetical protein
VPASLREHLAERRWAQLALRAGLEACDARRCAKLAKVRKQAWRRERRVVRQMLKEAAA